MPRKKKSAAQKVGTVFAHFQSMIDDVSQWAFAKLKDAGSKAKKNKIKSPETVAEKVKYGAQKTAEFIGETGETFYKEYQKIKAEKIEIKSKKWKK